MDETLKTCEKNQPCIREIKQPSSFDNLLCTSDNEFSIKGIFASTSTELKELKNDVSEIKRSNSIEGEKSEPKKDEKGTKKKKPKFRPKKNISVTDYYTKCNYNDMLAITPFPFTDLYNKVPKPKEANIENGLPCWNNSALDSKLTIIPSPEGLFVCTRGKAGEKVFFVILK